MKTLLLITLMLLMVCPVFAQDETAEPVTQAPVSIVTAEAPNTGDVTVINNLPATETPPATADEPWYAKYITGFGGMLVLLGGALIAINRWLEAAKHNISSMTIAEGGFSRLPVYLKAPLVSGLKEFIRLGGNLQEILTELEDDTPYATRPPTPDSTPPRPTGLR